MMRGRNQLAERCVEQLVRDGHRLFGCECGRVHFEPVLGVVNPTGWTTRQLWAMYASGVVGAAALVAAMMFWTV